MTPYAGKELVPCGGCWRAMIQPQSCDICPVCGCEEGYDDDPASPQALHWAAGSPGGRFVRRATP